MTRHWAQVRDELSRTVFEGQYDLLTGEPAPTTMMLAKCCEDQPLAAEETDDNTQELGLT